MIFLVFYFPEPSFMTKLFWMVKTIFCYLVPNLSYKGGSLFQLNLDRLYNVYFNGRACNKVVKYSI